MLENHYDVGKLTKRIHSKEKTMDTSKWLLRIIIVSFLAFNSYIIHEHAGFQETFYLASLLITAFLFGYLEKHIRVHGTVKLGEINTATPSQKAKPSFTEEK